MRILVVMPHYFRETGADETNRSRRIGARPERLRALVAAISGLHQSFGSAVYGLDHQQRAAWQAVPAGERVLDLIVCTAGDAHLLADLAALRPLFQHHQAAVDPPMLGFEGHRLLAEAAGRYDYYAYVEDDVVVTDPFFLDKRRTFDGRFGPDALLQPNRYELSATGPVHKLYVDYRLNPQVTERYQNLADTPRLEMPFLDRTIGFERPTYPSAGCFFLSAAQLERWAKGPYYLDGDVSYLSPLDSAVTLSVMKTFRIYKPALPQAWFLEVLHASPRWISLGSELPLKPFGIGQ